MATDLHPAALEAAHARAAREGVSDRVEVRLADARTLFAFFPGRRFDAVLAEGLADELGAGPLAQAAQPLLAEEGTFAITKRAWKTFKDEDVSEALRDAFPGTERAEPVMEALAAAGFRKGFAYELEAGAWSSFYSDLRGALSRAGSAGAPGADAALAWVDREIALLQADGFARIGCFVFGGFVRET